MEDGRVMEEEEEEEGRMLGVFIGGSDCGRSGELWRAGKE